MIETPVSTNTGIEDMQPRLLITVEQRKQWIEQSKANELLVIRLKAKAMAADLIQRLERDAEKGDVHTWDTYVMHIADTPDSWLNERIAGLLKKELAVFLPGTYIDIQNKNSKVKINCLIDRYETRAHSAGSLLSADPFECDHTLGIIRSSIAKLSHLS